MLNKFFSSIFFSSAGGCAAALGAGGGARGGARGWLGERRAGPAGRAARGASGG